MNRTAALGKPTRSVGVNTCFVFQLDVARQLPQTTGQGPFFHSPKELSANAARAKPGLNIPGFQIRHRDRRSAVHVLVPNGHLDETAQSAIVAFGNNNYTGVLCGRELLNLQPLPGRAAVGPQGTAQANPLRQVMYG
jgi:hypothetical protein